MKRWTIALSLCLSTLCISSPVIAGEYDDLGKYHYTLLEDSKDKLHLKYRDQINFVISKQRFKHSFEAQQFCLEQNLPLGGFDPVVLLAMSGVCITHDFLKDTVTFDFSELDGGDANTGIWAWSDRAADTITLIFDGHGMDSQDVMLSDLNAELKKEVSLPAVCSNLSLINRNRM